MIELHNLSKTFGEHVIYSHLNMNFSSGKIIGITGPSGSGKTTLFNLIAGLTEPDSGQITGIDRTKLSYVFQEDRLLPWRTVRENLLFVAPGQEKKIEAILTMVGLEDWADAYPGALSGGMRQRAAIARAFSYPSEVLLMDEPFSSLDQALKIKLIEAFEMLFKRDPKTVLWISHDIRELKALCDEIYTLVGKPARFKSFGGQ